VVLRLDAFVWLVGTGRRVDTVRTPLAWSDGA
jgi:hypothetical protein